MRTTALAIPSTLTPADVALKVNEIFPSVISATVAEIADGKISLTLSATSAGVKVLGMAKAVVRK